MNWNDQREKRMPITGRFGSLQELMASSQDGVLIQVRRSLRSVISNLAAFFIAVLVVYLLNLLFYDLHLPTDIPILREISVRWLSIVPGLILLEVLRKYHDDLYILHTDRLTHYQGRLSLASSVPTLRYKDIRAVAVKQDIYGRFLDYGNIELSSAGQSGVELTLSGVRAPRELAFLIDQLRLQKESEVKLQAENPKALLRK